MRILVWGLVVVAIGWGFYAASMSVWQYLTVASAVDEVLTPGATGERVDAWTLRAAVLDKANRAGVPITKDEVAVVRTDGNLQLSVVWSFPVFIIKGETVLAVPLSITRTTPIAAAR